LMRYINVVDGILSNYIIVDDNLGAKKTWPDIAWHSYRPKASRLTESEFSGTITHLPRQFQGLKKRPRQVVGVTKK
jgi:hypothetical protein